MNVTTYLELGLLLDVSYQPGEAPSRDDPGEPASVEINSLEALTFETRKLTYDSNGHSRWTSTTHSIPLTPEFREALLSALLNIPEAASDLNSAVFDEVSQQLD